MPKYKYRLRKLYRKHKAHNEWAVCDEETRQRVEKQSPKRFEFVAIEEGSISPRALVKEESTQEAKAKKETESKTKRGRKPKENNQKVSE